MKNYSRRIQKKKKKNTANVLDSVNDPSEHVSHPVTILTSPRARVPRASPLLLLISDTQSARALARTAMRF